MPNQTSPKAPRTLLEILKWTSDYFAAHHIDSPRLTAEILLAEALGLDRIDLYVRFDQPLSQDERRRFKALIRRRIEKEPVAYILGRKGFWNVTLDVTGDVLIPRPETEVLVEAALDRLAQITDHTPRVIDVGTGSGAIVVAMAASDASSSSSQPSSQSGAPSAHFSAGRIQYFASDRSAAAVRVAAANAVQNAVADRIRFFVGNWLAPVAPGPSFDMIIANPPYVASGDIARLAPEIRRYEPLAALDGDESGLRDIAALVAAAPGHLAAGGLLMLEIGWDQKEALRDLAQKTAAYEHIEFVQDYSGHNRVAVLEKSSTIN